MNSFFTIALKIMNIPNLYYPNDNMRTFYINAYSNTSIHQDHFKIYNMIYDIYYLMLIDNKNIHSIMPSIKYLKRYYKIFFCQKIIKRVIHCYFIKYRGTIMH